MKAGAVIQARMGSTRLPGKALADLGGRPILGRVLDRARLADSLAMVGVATTTDERIDPIAAFCATEGVPCHRGPVDNVLHRYVEAADRWQIDPVVRITGDCPFLLPDSIDALVGALVRTHADYAGYSGPRIGEGVDPFSQGVLAGFDRMSFPQMSASTSRYSCGATSTQSLAPGSRRSRGWSLRVRSGSQSTKRSTCNSRGLFRRHFRPIIGPPISSPPSASGPTSAPSTSMSDERCPPECADERGTRCVHHGRKPRDRACDCPRARRRGDGHRLHVRHRTRRSRTDRTDDSRAGPARDIGRGRRGVPHRLAGGCRSRPRHSRSRQCARQQRRRAAPEAVRGDRGGRIRSHRRRQSARAISARPAAPPAHAGTGRRRDHQHLHRWAGSSVARLPSTTRRRKPH